jgi:anti-sigma-K factor RskA
MSQDERDYEESLRRLLHEAADSVRPGAEGLERIRARLTRPRPAILAWTTAAASVTVRRALGAAESASARLQAAGRAAAARLRAAGGGRAGMWRYSAAATLAIVAVAGALALTRASRHAWHRAPLCCMHARSRF